MIAVMKRMLFVAAGAVAFGIAGSASAGSVHLVASPATVAPGGVVRVSATSSPCHVGGNVTLISAAFPGHAFGIGAVYGRIRSSGAFSVVTRVRRGLKPGRYHVSVRCGGGNLRDLAYFRVR